MFFRLLILVCFLIVLYLLINTLCASGGLISSLIQSHNESFDNSITKLRSRSPVKAEEIREEFKGSGSSGPGPKPPAPHHPKPPGPGPKPPAPHHPKPPGPGPHHPPGPHPPRPPRYTGGYYSGGGYYYPGYYNTYALPFLGEYPPVYNIEYVYPEDTMYTMLNTYDNRRGWYRIGVLLGNRKECKKDCGIILTLYRKTIDPDREIFEYKIIDDNKPGRLEIFLPTNIYFRLKDGDVIPQVTGYEDYSPMLVRLDNEFRYAVVRT